MKIVLIAIPYLKTHNIGLTRPIAAFSVSVGPDGIVLSQPLGALPEVDQSEEQETAEDTVETLDATLLAQVAKPAKQNGKLIAAEETAEGHVGLSASMLVRMLCPIRRNKLIRCQ